MAIAPEMTAPLRLRLDGDALVHNWRWLKAAGGAAACGAAVKANGYGLGAVDVTTRLLDAGCRDFFVATWAEAAEVAPLLPEDASLSVFHGVRAADMEAALASRARPVLNTTEQVVRWKPTGRACDVMIDTGMNRLGLRLEEAKALVQSFDGLRGLSIDLVISHLACASEPAHPANAAQLARFREARTLFPEARASLANSAGVFLGQDYLFDLVKALSSK